MKKKMNKMSKNLIIFKVLFTLLVVFDFQVLTGITNYEITTSEHFIGSENVTINFTNVTNKDNAERSLLMELPNGQKEIIWKNNSSINDFLLPTSKWRDPYKNAEIVSAALKGNVLLVVFKLKTRENRFMSSLLLNGTRRPQDISQMWNGEEYFLRSFVKKPSGIWDIYLSAFLNTIFLYSLNDQLIATEILDKNKYAITYKGSSSIVENQLSAAGVTIVEEYYKVVDVQGSVVRTLEYHVDRQLLFSSVAGDEKLTYAQGAYWWIFFDEFSNSSDTEFNFDEIMKMRAERINNLDIETTNQDSYRIIDKETFSRLSSLLNIDTK